MCTLGLLWLFRKDNSDLLHSMVVQLDFISAYAARMSASTKMALGLLWLHRKEKTDLPHRIMVELDDIKLQV